MAEEHETKAISKLLDRHFYHLTKLLEQSRTRWPHHSDFINGRLIQYATNVFELLPDIEHVIPSIQYDKISQGYGECSLPPNFQMGTGGQITPEYTSNVTLPALTGSQNESASLVTQPAFPSLAPAPSNHSLNLASSCDITPSFYYQYPLSITAADHGYVPAAQFQSADGTEQCHAPALKKPKRQDYPPQSLQFSLYDKDYWISLKSLIGSLSASDDVSMYCDLKSLSSVFRKMQELDLQGQSYALRGRILLYHFATHREEVLRETRDRRSQRDTVLPQGTKKIESEALDALVTEIFPDTVDTKKEYDLEEWRRLHDTYRKEIKNKHQKAKNWCKAVDRFSLGVLLIIPRSGDLEWQDYKFEKLNGEQCEKLFGAWSAENGTFLNAAAYRLSTLIHKLFNGEESFEMLPLQATEVPSQINEDVINKLLGTTSEDHVTGA